MGVKTIWELCLFQVGLFVSLKRLQMEDSFFGQKETGAGSCYGNSTKGVILFLLWWTIVVPSFKNTALIFLEKLFLQHFTIFSCKQYDVITDLIFHFICTLNSIMRWLSNVTILLFTRTFETWYSCFSRKAKGILHDPFVFWYLKGNVLWK